MTQIDWLEAEYFAFPGGSDRPSLAVRWERDGREAMALPHRRLAYGEGPRRALELFLPEGADGAPLFVFFHGGYWQRGTREAFAWIVPGFLQAGVGVAMMGYPIAPEVPLEAIVEAAGQGLDCLAEAVPGRSVLLSGHSAGGHLVAMLGAQAGRFESLGLLVRGLLPVSGVFELTPLLGTSVNDALGLDRARAQALSPQLLAVPSVPVLAAVGGEESAEFQRQTGAYARHASGRAGAASIAVPGRNHFTVLDALADPSQPLFRAAVGMLLHVG